MTATDSAISRPTTPALARLLDELDMLRPRLIKTGDLMWSRTSDWVKAQQPKNGERGGGTSAPSDERIFDLMGDRQASRYHDEVKSIVNRMAADADRLRQIIEIADQRQPRQIAGKDMLATQVAAAGFCVSCWRNDQHCVEIEIRTSGPAAGQPYYRDLCRFCGGWKAEYGDIPQLDVVQRHYDGRRITRPA